MTCDRMIKFFKTIKIVTNLNYVDILYYILCTFNCFQLVTPMKATEQLVEQLKTQIADLERFIEYIQSKLKVKTTSLTHKFQQNFSNS